MPEGIMTWVLGMCALLVVALFVFRALRTPKRQTAMALWAVFGPYDQAEIATDSLRRACRAVFGQEEMAEQNDWLEKTARIFHDWEAQGQFHSQYKAHRDALLLIARGRAFEKAYRKMKDELGQEVAKGAELLNNFLADSGYSIEAVREQDGTVKLIRKQIWSDEEIERKSNERGERTLNVIGRVLLADQSEEGKQLLEFLRLVDETNGGKGIETPKDVGVMWFACCHVVDKEPDSLIAQTFKVLNDAWQSALKTS